MVIYLMDNTKFGLVSFFSYSFLLSGVLIYAAILVATELDAKYKVLDTVQEKVFDILGITERPVSCQNSTNQTFAPTMVPTSIAPRNQTDTSNVTQNFAFKIDPEDYGDNDNDYLEHVLLDEEVQKQEEELKSILNKIPQQNKKNEENQANTRKSNTNKTGSKKYINKKKLRRKKKVTKCSRVPNC